MNNVLQTQNLKENFVKLKTKMTIMVSSIFPFTMYVKINTVEYLSHKGI